MHEDGGLRRLARRLEEALHPLQPVGHQHRAGRKVAEDEFVALLGDLGLRADIDDAGHALLLGDLGDRRGGAGFEGADDDVGAVADHLLGLGARDVGARFGVDVHQLHRHAHVGEDRHGEVAAALAGLADEGEEAGARQEDADLDRLGSIGAPAQQGRAGHHAAGGEGEAVEPAPRDRG